MITLKLFFINTVEFELFKHVMNSKVNLPKSVACQHKYHVRLHFPLWVDAILNEVLFGERNYSNMAIIPFSFILLMQFYNLKQKDILSDEVL